MSRTSGGTVIINGTPTVVLGYSGNNRKTIESSLYSRGFMVYPKDLSTNISVENIQKHPELFERFIYLPIFGENIIDTINNNLDFIDGKLMNKEKMDDGTYEYFDMADKDKEYLEDFYPNELKEFLDKINSLKRPKYKFEEVEVIAAGGKDSFKRIIGVENANDSTITKSIGQEKRPKRNTSAEQPSVKEKEAKVETYIESFNDSIKSLTPEQLNMKLNIAGKGEPPREVTVSDFMNQINGFANALKNMEENAKSGTLIVGTPVEKAHTAKDIDFNNPEELVRVDSKEIKTPIMEPKEERFIVDNNQQEPPKEPQQPTQDNTIVVKDQQLASVITRLQAAGTFTVTTNIESGIIRVIVKDTNDKQIDNLCFTVDLDGVCQAPLRKMWFGLPEHPDFEPSYLFDDKSIEALFTGEGFDQLNVVFNKNTCDINKLVDIRSIFNNPDELVRVDKINYTHIAEALD